LSEKEFLVVTYKAKTTITPDNEVVIVLSPETLKSLGIVAGDEIDVTTTGKTVILRSVAEAEKNRKIQAATEKVFNRWDKVFTELAKGTEADK
jgi:anaerobic selenocysteine-containing dehydrogenase